MTTRKPPPLNPLEYHVLLALAGGTLYGYAIKEAVEAQSEGALTPRAGSLYRVLARMMSRGFVGHADRGGTGEPHPGLARKYYVLTPAGREAVRSEAVRLRDDAALAERRLGALDSGA